MKNNIIDSSENFSSDFENHSIKQKGILQFVDRSYEIVDRLNYLLSRDSSSKSKLAKALGKKEPEITKWTSGIHNFTVKTLAKIEAALGESIIIPVGGEDYVKELLKGNEKELKKLDRITKREKQKIELLERNYYTILNENKELSEEIERLKEENINLISERKPRYSSHPTVIMDYSKEISWYFEDFEHKSKNLYIIHVSNLNDRSDQKVMKTSVNEVIITNILKE